MKKFKFLKDSFYKDTFDHFKSVEDVVSAGWFDDGLKKINYNEKFLCTPFDKITINLKDNNENKPVAILLTTGGFAPLHQGHVDMMELSKKELEKKGYFVAGGYFSPSHDKYVLSKYDSSIKMTALERIDFLNKEIDLSPWLMVDPWESLFVPTSINFTDVISRLDMYLKNTIDINFEIFYVFGSDNYNFYKAFIKKGNCCCVERMGFSGPIFDCTRMHYVKNENKETSNLSSKKIREEKRVMISKEPSTLPYLIRNDIPGKKLDLIKSKVNHVFKQFITNPTVWISLDEQQEILNNIEGNIINLDKLTKKGIGASTSRVFGVASIQSKPHSIDVKLSEEIDFSKEYILVDDDIASGATMRMFKEKYPDLNVKDKVGLSKVWYENKYKKPYDIYDIVDFRDFLLGVDHGGLYVALGDNRARVPYLYPFVNLESRAKIPFKNGLEFSKEILRINIEYYQENKKITVADCHELFQCFCLKSGFKKKDSLYSVSKTFLSWINPD